jgi:hypothetical protein
MEADPHPLVVTLVQELLKRRLESFDESTKQELAKRLAHPKRAEEMMQDPKAADSTIKKIANTPLDELGLDGRTRLAQAADYVDIPDLVTFVGYLGGTIDAELNGRNVKWWILYIDSQLQNWRFIADADIVLHKAMADDSSPFNTRDMIWVHANTLTARGEAPPRPEVQAQFLRGDFTRAGDLAAAPGAGGPTSPRTGGFCDVITPYCCTKTVRP